jgi:hypothetical protein
MLDLSESKPISIAITLIGMIAVVVAAATREALARATVVLRVNDRHRSQRTEMSVGYRRGLAPPAGREGS